VAQFSMRYRSQQLLYRWFLFNHRWVNLLWLSALITAMAYQSYLGYHYNSNDTTNIFLQVARIGAYNLLILLVVLWLPVLQHSTAWLLSIGLRVIFPVQNTRKLHEWLGHALLAFACVHGTFYLLYFDSLEGDFVPILLGEEADLVRSMRTTMYDFVTFDESIDEVSHWVEAGRPQDMYQEVVAPIMSDDCTKCHSDSSTQTYAIPSLPLTDYDSVKALSETGVMSRQFRIDVSGLVMLTLFLAIWLTSLPVFRKRHFPWYQHVHRLGYLIAALALLHIPRFEYLVAPVALLGFEFLHDRITRSFHACPARLTLLGPSLAALSIQLPRPIRVPPGHFVRIRIPGLEKREWHSFSLLNSSASTQELRVLIKDLGDWTRNLMSLEHPEVDVRGPYASPFSAYGWKHRSLFFVGGIGITPMMSLIDVCDAQVRLPPLQVVWAFQDWKLMGHLAPILADWVRRHPQVSVSCHATRPKPEEYTLPPNLPFSIHQGRPDPSAWVQQLKDEHDGRHEVYVCGPLSLVRMVRHSLRRTPNWRLYIEHF